jgi:hypothetical protein
LIISEDAAAQKFPDYINLYGPQVVWATLEVGDLVWETMRAALEYSSERSTVSSATYATFFVDA